MSKILELREKRAKAWEAAKAFLDSIHACLAAGDRPRAILLAERHMGLLRKQLEITPDPEIRRLVELARARPVAGTGN